MKDALELAKASIERQIESLQLTAAQLDDSLLRAVNLAATAPKVVTSGLGKSSFIARKLAATLLSVRIPSVYIHPVDALHGDSGILTGDDVLIVFSKSGETAEVVRLASLASELGIKIISITGRSSSTIATHSDAALIAVTTHEFDDDNLIPTTSTTAALVLADVLAVMAAQRRGRVSDQLRRSHPDGSIGSALLRTVDEIMHSGDRMPILTPQDSVGRALHELTDKALGLVCVCDNDGTLLGIITDGDIRRLATNVADFANMALSEVMTQNPVTASPGTTLHEALTMMERRDRQIAVLPVVHEGRCVGVVRLHDIVRLGI